MKTCCFLAGVHDRFGRHRHGRATHRSHNFNLGKHFRFKLQIGVGYFDTDFGGPGSSFKIRIDILDVAVKLLSGQIGEGD